MAADESIDDQISRLIKEIEVGGGGGYGIQANKSRIDALLAAEISRTMNTLTGTISTAERNISLRLNGLNTQLENTRIEWHESSQAATKQAKSLVVGTRWLALATLVVAFLTAALVYVSFEGVQITLKGVQVAEQEMRTHVEPELYVDIFDTGKGAELFLKNEGAYPIININVDVESTTYAGPPVNRIVTTMRMTSERSGQSLLHLSKLMPEETHAYNLKSVMLDELKRIDFLEDINDKDKSIHSQKAVRHTLLHIKVRFQRDVDKKLFRKVKTVVLERDARTAQPMLIDPIVFGSIFPYLKDVLNMYLSEERSFR